MKRTINREILAFSIPFLLMAGLIFLTQQKIVLDNSIMSLAITVDLVFTVPFIYFLLIYKTKIPKTSIVSIISLGIIIGSCFLPIERQYYLDVFKVWMIPILKLLAFVFFIYKLNYAIEKFKAYEKSNIDFYERIKLFCFQFFPKKIASIIAVEIGVLYYGFINWKKSGLKSNEFTYHKKNESVSLFLGLVLLIVVETFVLHIIIQKYNEIMAWIFSVLGIYTIIQVFGMLRSIIKRPIVIDNEVLNLRYGILSETKIKFYNIQAVQISTKKTLDNVNFNKLSPLGNIESFNILLTLKNECTLNRLYGVKKTCSSIVFFVDNPIDFMLLMNEKIT